MKSILDLLDTIIAHKGIETGTRARAIVLRGKLTGDDPLGGLFGGLFR